MFDNEINKVYNIVTAVRTYYMNIKGRDRYQKSGNEHFRYAVKPKKKARFTVKRRILLTRRRLKQHMNNTFNLPLKKSVKKQRRLPSLKYILPLFLSFLVVFGAALVFSFIRAEKATVSTIEEKQPKMLTIHYGQKYYEVFILDGIVKDALLKAGLSIDSDDEVIPSEYTDIDMIDEAWVIKTDIKIVSREADVAFKTVELPTEELKPGETKVIIEGKNGRKALKLKLIYKNNLLSSQVKLSEEIIKQPINKEIKVGKPN